MPHRTARERKADDVAFLRVCGVVAGLPLAALGIGLIASGAPEAWWEWMGAAGLLALGAYLVAVALLGPARWVERLPLPGGLEALLLLLAAVPLHRLWGRVRPGRHAGTRRPPRR